MLYAGAAIVASLAVSLAAYADEPMGATVSASLATAGGPSATASVARMVGGLFLCLGVFAVVVRMLKRNARTKRGSRRLEVRERVALSSKASLQLIAVDNREFLVSSTAEQVSIVPLHSMTTEVFADSLDALDRDDEAYNA
jgi:flagellar biogenesis protein FliO